MDEVISIIVPVYNAEKHLRECIDSIINQEYKQIEVILIDDGSTDNSLGICKEYEGLDSRIRVIAQQNSGVSVARNNGIDAATGDYLAFVDSDDVILPNMYTSLLDCSRKGYALSMCNYFQFNESGYNEVVDQLSSFGQDNIASSILIERVINCSPKAVFGSVWRVLFESKLIKNEDVRFTPGLTMAEDMQFLLKCLSKTDVIGVCTAPLYKFRVSTDSTTGKYMKKQDEDMKYVNDWMTEFVGENSLPQQVLDGVFICKANTIVFNIANTCKRNTPFSFTERLSYARRVLKDKDNKTMIKFAYNHRKDVVKKRSVQIAFLRFRLLFFVVFYHSYKNGTLIKKGQ